MREIDSLIALPDWPNGPEWLDWLAWLVWVGSWPGLAYRCLWTKTLLRRRRHMGQFGSKTPDQGLESSFCFRTLWDLVLSNKTLARNWAKQTQGFSREAGQGGAGGLVCYQAGRQPVGVLLGVTWKRPDIILIVIIMVMQQEDKSLVSWPWRYKGKVWCLGLEGTKAKPHPPRILSSVFFSWHLADWISEFRLINIT